MAKAGHRYPLLLYEYMLNRWWRATFALSIALFGLWQALKYRGIQTGRVLLPGLGALSLGFTIFLFLSRKAAYVRPYRTHLRLVTPFLRMNISYKRFRRTTTTKMAEVFPPSQLSNWMREVMAPLLPKTVIVIDLNGYPLPRALLRFFLSPFFFKDKTSNLVLLVENWMGLSTEMESLRTGGDIAPKKKKRPPTDSILSRLPRG
jgi:hypothetical protein